MSQQAGPVNEEELVARAVGLLPRRIPLPRVSPLLHVVVGGAPAQQVLRPSALDDPELHRDMQREAVYGDRPVLDPGQGVERPVVRGITLTVRQATAEITLDEQGNVRVSSSWP